MLLFIARSVTIPRSRPQHDIIPMLINLLSMGFAAMIVQIYPEGTGRTLAQAIYIAAWPTGGAFSLLASGFVAE
jgi:hypothetical protein